MQSVRAFCHPGRRQGLTLFGNQWDCHTDTGIWIKQAYKGVNDPMKKWTLMLKITGELLDDTENSTYFIVHRIKG